jgi:hypothetical protein
MLKYRIVELFCSQQKRTIKERERKNPETMCNCGKSGMLDRNWKFSAVSDVAGQHRIDIGPSANISDNGIISPVTTPQVTPVATNDDTAFVAGMIALGCILFVLAALGIGFLVWKSKVRSKSRSGVAPHKS